MFDAPERLARSPLVYVIWKDRLAVLASDQACGSRAGIDWRCLGGLVDTPWSAIGGPSDWNNVAVGHADPRSDTVGLLALGQEATSKLGRVDLGRDDVQDFDFSDWFTDVERRVRPAPAGGQSTPMLTRGPSELGVAQVTEAEACTALRGSSRRSELDVVVPQPVTTADVVFAARRGAKDTEALRNAVTGDAARQALTKAGWRLGDARERASVQRGGLRRPGRVGEDTAARRAGGAARRTRLLTCRASVPNALQVNRGSKAEVCSTPCRSHPKTCDPRPVDIGTRQRRTELPDEAHRGDRPGGDDRVPRPHSWRCRRRRTPTTASRYRWPCSSTSSRSCLTWPSGSTVRMPRRSTGGASACSVSAKSSGAAATLLEHGWPHPAENGPRPVVWSPAATVWASVLNQRLADKGEQVIMAPAGTPVMISPLVIAMPETMAKALGWPTKAIGYSDILQLATDPNGWGAVGHTEWGAFKLGKTNPNFSTSGLSSLVAQYYVFAGKQAGLSPEDIANPEVEEKAGDVESAVVHYGDTTLTFLNHLYEADLRGVPLSYASAVAVEEQSVVNYNEGNPDGKLDPGEKPKAPHEKLVAIYPKEGTLFSDNPYIVLDAEKVGGRRPEEGSGEVRGVRPAAGQPATGAAVRLPSRQRVGRGRRADRRQARSRPCAAPGHHTRSTHARGAEGAHRPVEHRAQGRARSSS